MNNNKQCLVLGTAGVGKTLLIKTLTNDKSLVKSKGALPTATLLPPTIHATVGTNLTDYPLSKGVYITLKECGGVMAPLWLRSLDDADMLIYIVDCSNNTQISAATVLLMDILASGKMNSKPLLLFYNKTDIATGCPLSLNEFKQIMRVKDLVGKYGDSISVINGSCLTRERLDYIHQWLRKHSSSTK